MTKDESNYKEGFNSPGRSNILDASNFSADDLIALIRAVKFAHPEMSMRGVYNEISGTMADSDESYAFLKKVHLNDVKKVWKKALKGFSESIQDNAPNKNDVKPQSVISTSKPVESVPVPSDGILKFYTVGDGSVKTLVENYANHHAGAKIAASHQTRLDEKQDLEKYTHFFADVPADRSGSRPHQALINFNDNRNTMRSNKKKNYKADSKCRSKGGDDREIFKIQLAALPAGMEEVLTPMLLYNSDRTTKTFIHPPSPSDKDQDDGGYFTIKTMITESGTSGALGAAGGQKVRNVLMKQNITLCGQFFLSSS